MIKITEGSCVDSPSNWNDGEDNCADYASNDWCEDYGDYYSDDNGVTAAEACCACGGGELCHVHFASIVFSISIGSNVYSNNTHFAHRSNQITIIIHTGSNTLKLWVSYNKPEGMTADFDSKYESSFGNHVIINSATEQDGRRQDLLAGLSAGQSYTKSNFAGTGKNLIIEVCSITAGTPDVAKVIVYLESVTSASCAPVSSPVSSPVSQPTVATCIDSPLVFKQNGRNRTCNWVRKKANIRCKKNAIRSHCPDTCDNPKCGNSFKKFYVKELDDFRKCKWVRNKNTANRCKKTGVADTCKATCADI